MSNTSSYIITKYEEQGHVVAPRAVLPRVSPVNLIRTALEAAGVEFTNGDAPGVRLRKVEA